MEDLDLMELVIVGILLAIAAEVTSAKQVLVDRGIDPLINLWGWSFTMKSDVAIAKLPSLSPD